MCSASGSVMSCSFTCISCALMSVSSYFSQLFLMSQALVLPEWPEVTFLFVKVALKSLKSMQHGLLLSVILSHSPWQFPP